MEFSKVKIKQRTEKDLICSSLPLIHYHRNPTLTYRLLLENHPDSFINLQYTALTTAINLGYKKRKPEDYLMPGEGIDLTTDIDRTKFAELITNTITPLHRIARNQGVGMWNL